MEKEETKISLFNNNKKMPLCKIQDFQQTINIKGTFNKVVRCNIKLTKIKSISLHQKVLENVIENKI